MTPMTAMPRQPSSVGRYFCSRLIGPRARQPARAKYAGAGAQIRLAGAPGFRRSLNSVLSPVVADGGPWIGGREAYQWRRVVLTIIDRRPYIVYDDRQLWSDRIRFALGQVPLGAERLDCCDELRLFRVDLLSHRTG